MPVKAPSLKATLFHPILVCNLPAKYIYSFKYCLSGDFGNERAFVNSMVSLKNGVAFVLVFTNLVTASNEVLATIKGGNNPVVPALNNRELSIIAFKTICKSSDAKFSCKIFAIYGSRILTPTELPVLSFAIIIVGSVISLNPETPYFPKIGVSGIFS